MKQQITPEQNQQIQGRARDKFREWYAKVHPELEGITYAGDISTKFFPTIGQMIEFLGDDLISIQQWRVPLKEFWNVATSKNYYEAKELIDALWEAVKEILIKGDEI